MYDPMDASNFLKNVSSLPPSFDPTKSVISEIEEYFPLHENSFLERFVHYSK